MDWYRARQKHLATRVPVPRSTAATKVYDGFRMLVSTTGIPQGLFGYNGTSCYQEDAATGLMLLGHRYHDSNTGRFITRDPTKYGSNLWECCGDNPVRRIDPNGFDDTEVAMDAAEFRPWGIQFKSLT